MRLLIIFLNILLLATASNSTFNGIPKILWTFWDSGLDSASLFTRMCVNNMQYYTNISGWEFKFLSNKNYTQYISKEGLERIDRMYSQTKHKIGKQNWADLMRLVLIYENGGMWLDTNSFFIGNLSWIQNLSQEKWAYNRISDVPQVITFSLNSVMGGNRTNVYDQQLKQNIQLFPGLEIWSFISKPKSTFLQEVINRLEYSLKTSRQILDNQTETENIRFGREKDPYYITSNYLFQTVLQKKQHELQSKVNLSVKQKYAVGYYKLWTIPAQDTIYGIFSAYNWFTFIIIDSIFKENIDTFATKYNIPPYFIKFNGGNYPHANNALVLHEFAKCLGVNVNIQEGSVFDEFMMKRNQDLQEIKGIKKMYQLGYMDDNQCKHNDEKVFAYLSQLKGKFYWLGFAVIIFHVLLFYMVKRSNNKQD